MSTSPAAAGDPRPTPAQLTEQRDRLQQWLARLDEVGRDVPAHVTERVRSDYRERLRAVTEALRAHRDALSADLQARRGDLDAAEARRAEAADALAEARLRHLLGELDDDVWTVRSPGLESALASAEAEVTRYRGEVRSLEALLDEMEGGAPAPVSAAAAPVVPPAPAEAAPAPSGDDTLPEYVPPAAPREPSSTFAADPDDGFDLAWLDDIGTGGDPAPAGAAGSAADASAPAEAPAADDLAFLAELDRAIAASGEPARGAGAGGPGRGDDPDRTLDADRAGMLLCKECGAINEPQAWYCEVCGSEL